MECTHTDQIRDVKPKTRGCEECLKSGQEWVHLRLCMECGHVGCCDSSIGKHATKHFHKTKHPVMRSLEPSETWGWCFVDEVMLDFAQMAPGSAGGIKGLEGGAEMKTTQVAKYGHQLTRFGVVNCYLVREDDGLTLIDTGIGGTADGILAAASVLGGTIRRILLTHAHVDHVGSVDALLKRLGAGIDLISNARSLPLLQKPPDKSPKAGDALGKIKGGLPGIDAKPTRLLREAERCGSLLCIDTPGHIPGHMSFLDERDGTLYAGDALTSIGELRVSSDAPWYFPIPKLVTWNADVALASAEKLLGYTIERFACGHGGIKSGSALLKSAINKARA